MKKSRGYKSVPLSINRKMVIASIAINKRSAIHSLTEIDVTEPRKLIRLIPGFLLILSLFDLYSI